MTNQRSSDDSPNIWLIIFFVFLSLGFLSCLILLLLQYFGKKLEGDLDADLNYREEQQRFKRKKLEEDVDVSVPFLQKANINSDKENYSWSEPIQQQMKNNEKLVDSQISNNQDHPININQKDDFQFQQSNSPKHEIDVSQQYQEKKQDFLLIVQKLYDLSINKREVEEEFRSFVGPPLNQKKLVQYYADDNEKIEDQLKKQLKGFRRIRGDGNCFYTAFTYQYLELVLNIFEQKQFDQIIGHIRTMNFQMEYEEEFKIPIEAQNPLANCFADRLIELRHNPKDFFQQFSDPTNHLYGLSILYMRNLVNEIYLSNEMAQTIDATLSKDFLFWEKECNLNEIVIAFLADELQLQINCYFIDQQRDVFKHDVYQEECANQIHLILQPGHYQIGVSIIGNG